MTDYALFTQILCIVLLILFGVFTFRRYPLESSVKSLTTSAMLVVMALLLNMFSINIGEVFKFNLTFFPLALAGILISPSWCFLIGIAFDFIGLMLTPTGYPFFGFTLNHVLATTVPGIWYASSIDLDPKKIMRFIDFLLIGMATAGSLYVLNTSTFSLNGTLVRVTSQMKIFLPAAMFIVAVATVFILHKVKERYNEDEANELAKWIAVVLFSELVISMFLTPLWLNIMYGMPMLVSMFIRIIKQTVAIPLMIIIGYSLVKASKHLRIK